MSCKKPKIVGTGKTRKLKGGGKMKTFKGHAGLKPLKVRISKSGKRTYPK